MLSRLRFSFLQLGILFVLTSILLPAASQTLSFGLMQPITLSGDTTMVITRDYILQPSMISNVTTPDFLQARLSDNKDTLLLIRNGREMQTLSTLHFSAGNEMFDVLLKKPRKIPVSISFDPNGKKYTQVNIVGDLTNWNPNVLHMQMVNGKWVLPLQLNPGRYQYQIVADGNWFLDPGNKDSIDNGIGGYNSLLNVGGSEGDAPDIYTVWEDSLTNTLDVSGSAEHYVVFWDNHQLTYKEIYSQHEEDFSEGKDIVIAVPEQAKSVKRSQIRIYAYRGNLISNDLLIPLEYGKVITDSKLLDRTDFQKTIMYFMMVDRFVNGDKSNDHPVDDARVMPQANYQGGDLAGVKQKIDDGYFEKLGVNTLWISPVFQNPMGAYQEFPEPHRWFSGYHGYWPISLSKVDVRFGTNAEFKSLVDDAHGNDMNIFLDYVANHIHAEHPLWTSHPEWFSQLDLPDGRKNLRMWDENRLTTWFEPYMPSFDHSQPAVAEACADSAMYWLTTFGIDGFRHDATKHIETEFWRLLTFKIKTEVAIPQQKPIYQIGETFGSRELIGSYIGSGLLDAQFDFDLYFDARAVFASGDIPFSRLSSSLKESFDYFGWHHVMGNISGNHDMARFISYASGDLKWNENAKEAGWNRHITITDTIGYARLKMLQAFNMTIPGIPIIYYGDEIGIPGGDDPDNRRMMYFDSLNRFEKDVFNTVSKLTQLRSNHMALLFGDFEVLQEQSAGSNDLQFAYLRSYFNDAVIVVFNRSSKQATLSYPLPTRLLNVIPQAQMGTTINRHGYQIDILDIPANSFEIITFDR
ncbi:MAG TPA: alpha-amylase family glycosyl hydrolase [Chitinophagales bacterium]|nr:alpha-amylase family glycosyl hydrolase [Chitinophagales bacterium]